MKRERYVKEMQKLKTYKRNKKNTERKTYEKIKTQRQEMYLELLTKEEKNKSERKECVRR